jgi:collagenase-like PrtC family protease
VLIEARAGDNSMKNHLTIGPILFHWPAEKKRDFYFNLADEAAVDTVYLGEVICSKRAPFFKPYLEEVTERLISAGKEVIFSSLAEILTMQERKATKDLCTSSPVRVEANHAAALYHLRGVPHRVGQYFNVYNEDTMDYLHKNGATHFALPVELPKDVLEKLAEKAVELGVSVELQVYGRAGLALSARCYHSRSHDRIKNNCQFICEQDPDGMTLRTIDGVDFLAINGIQTMSYPCLNYIREIPQMQKMGITHFRISPHSHDMIQIIGAFRGVIEGNIAPSEAMADISSSEFNVPFTNGYYYKKPGHVWHGG